MANSLWNHVKGKYTHITSWLLGIVISLFVMPAYAGYSIGGAGSTGPFGWLVEKFQNWLDFMQGPMGKMVVAIAAILAAIVWIFMPKEGIMGHLLRVVVAAFMIFNLAAVMGWLGGS